MATDTETLSLPTTTAPTDVTAPTAPTGLTAPTACLSGHKRRLDELEPVDWDTSIAPDLRLLVPGCVGGAGPAGGIPCPAGLAQQQEHRDDRSVEESCKRALHHFPSPAIAFPMPTLEFDFRVAVRMNPEPSRVENRVKEIAAISTGRWSASFGNGRVVAGGYDLGQARGFRPIRIVEGAFVLQTTDEPSAILEMRTRGSLSGPCDTLDALLSPRQPKDIDPRQYGFRMFATVKTLDRRYAEIVNCGLWVASGVWHGEELIIDAYRVI
ncbi:Uncharacterized protein TPAR_08901 [Tolypocladium paradoxum]|uniref:Uncharacterized protein n=1 Tax=Tolypocladium paradoxum TaxID=94208 RepID=A0A2S4KL24_9HYPO|nr:Uncharacterized protein TPAR_08901 [Tolypocladium paradoxum]